MKLKFLCAPLMLLLFAVHTLSAQEVENTGTKSLNKVILFKWKDDVTDYQKAEIENLFNDLVDEIAGFQSIESVDVVSERFETMYLLKFNSEEAENAYKAHDKHQILVTKGSELIADVMGYLYWE